MDVIVDPPTDQYASFPHQGINSGYGFDIDLMKVGFVFPTRFFSALLLTLFHP